ncbi:MAG TPA: GNAT family N-acetyltransferase [Gemmatimonadaceae bacterium]
MVLPPEEALALAATQAGLAGSLEHHLHDVRQGEELLAGIINDRLAAWNIVSCATRAAWPLSETASELPLRADDAVFTAGYVTPEFRGRRLFQAMYGASADLATQHGAMRLWSWCESHNEPSRKAMLAVGFRYAGSHSRRTVLGVRGHLRVEVAS